MSGKDINKLKLINGMTGKKFKDLVTAEKYIEKREKKYEVMSVTSACVIATGMYAKYRTRKTDFWERMNPHKHGIIGVKREEKVSMKDEDIPEELRQNFKDGVLWM